MIPNAIRGDRFVLALLFLGLLIARLCHSGIVWVEEAYPTSAAIQILHGKMLYRDVWFDKPPLSALAYLLWDARIGVTLRIAGAAFVFACCWMLWRFACDLWGPREGLAAALLLGFYLTFGIPAAVMALAPDLLMVLPHIAAVYLAWRGRAFLSGLAAGVALLVNAKAFFVLAVCLFFAWRGVLWLLGGFAIPNIVALIWFGRPYIDQVWRWGAMYSEQTFAFATGFIRTANWAGFQSALIVGAVVVLWKESRWRWKMAAWLLLSFVAVAAGWRFFPRYYFQLLPVMALLAARGYTLLGRCRWIMLVLLLIPMVRFGPRYVMLANDLAHRRQSNWSDLALNQDSKAVSDSIGRTGTLLVWGYRPDVFAYTRMPAGSRFLDSQPLTGVLADRHLSTSQPFAPEWAARNRRELIASDPTWIVDGLGPLNPALAITEFPDLREWLANYREVARTRFSIIYRLK
ncbi:MAG: ArnT family glycosyltransferase [Bryobacteraceae bacterium]